MIILNTLEKSGWQEWQPSEDRSISNSKGCSFWLYMVTVANIEGVLRVPWNPPFKDKSVPKNY